MDTYQDLPAVWVPEGEGASVLCAAREHASATVVLDATLTPGVQTETVWAVSPGALSDETVLVLTHTDGTNAVEENGHIGLLALAHDAATNPHDRTIVFIFVTGHLRIPAVTRHGQAATAWLEAHPELWAGQDGGKTAVAGIAIEHLGAVEDGVDSTVGTPAPTGRPEPELLYATTPELAEWVRQNWEGAAEGRLVPAKPSALIQFGEGEPLFERRIPAVALVTGPEYLLTETSDGIVDVEVLTRQVESFRRLLRYLGAASTSRDRLGNVKRPSKVRRIVAAVHAALIVAVRDRRSRP